MLGKSSCSIVENVVGPLSKDVVGLIRRVRDLPKQGIDCLSSSHVIWQDNVHVAVQRLVECWRAIPCRGIIGAGQQDGLDPVERHVESNEVRGRIQNSSHSRTPWITILDLAPD